MRGAYPAILDDPRLGAAARDLHRDALALLDQLVGEGRLTANAVVGFWPANSDVDDITVWCDDERQEARAVFRTLRQQMAKPDGRPNVALADFIAPAETGVADYIGAFAVTTGIGLDEIVAEFEAANDDYRRSSPRPSPIRLARPSPSASTSASGASCGATRPDEALTNTDLIAERYQGIRPAPGYPACPDHTEKATLFDLLEAESRAGIRLTESFAMWPGAAVSGYYLWNPDSHYFGVGRIGRDQLADYAARKGMRLAEAERWLAPNLVDEEPTRARAQVVTNWSRRSQGFRPVGCRGRRCGGTGPVADGEWGSVVARHLIAVEREVCGHASHRSSKKTSHIGRGRSPASNRVRRVHRWPRSSSARRGARARSVVIDGVRRSRLWFAPASTRHVRSARCSGLLSLAIDHDAEHLASLTTTD
jgi:hypothetical protein